MVSPEEIVAAAIERLGPGAPTKEGALAGRHVVVTAGPTWEAVDDVRFLGNRSSGKMGFALAEAAARLGAEVTLIAGPVGLATPALVGGRGFSSWRAPARKPLAPGRKSATAAAITTT